MSAYKLVPVEPTQDMIDAGVDATCVDISEKAAAWIYDAMLTAATEVEHEPEAWIINHPHWCGSGARSRALA